MKHFAVLILLSISWSSYGQHFLNGDFEINSVDTDQINLSNFAYNNSMANSTAFGSYGDMDIITSSTYCGAPQSGNWFVALTGAGTDAISLELSNPLISGENYSMSFYDRNCYPYDSGSVIKIGVSTGNTSLGNNVYTAPQPVYNGGWTQRTFSFSAPINAGYVTVTCAGGGLSSWVHVDNFIIVSPTSAQSINPNNLAHVFPNLFSNQLTVTLAENVQTTIILYDFTGRQILQQSFTNSTTINTAQLADGIYFYELINDTRIIKSGKLIKQ